MVGERVLHHCLSSAQVGEVRLIGRRGVAVDDSRVVSVEHSDFLDFSSRERAFDDIDSAVYCVGAYSGSVDDSEFRKVTVGFTESFGRTLAERSPEAGLVFLSGQGADLSERSRIPFARYKGMAENALLRLAFPRLDIFRPGYIYPTFERKEPNFAYRLFRLFYPALAQVYPNIGIGSDELGWSMAEAALADPLQMSGPIWENSEIRLLAASRHAWTARREGPQPQKTFVVPGANTGLGLETVKMCARAGATVIMACRDAEKGAIAQAEVTTRFPNSQVEFEVLDLASLTSVEDFAKRLTSRLQTLDGLVNNAGVMMCPYGKTEDGFETQMGVNHLGHFALTLRLLPLLQAAPEGRVVSVSSIAHKRGSMDFDNLLFEGGEGYAPAVAYRRSKLANLLFTFELQRRLAESGSTVLSLAAHPGISRTELGRYLEGSVVSRTLSKLLFAKFAQPAAIGALPQMRALLDGQAQSGDFYGPDGFRETRGYPVKVEAEEQARDAGAAAELWERSEQLTGLEFSKSL